MEKIYRVKLNNKGMPNFATAVEIADRPQGEWIPCSERLPQGNPCEAVLVSVCADDALHDVVFMLARRVEDYYKKGWVNAWMPSPQPYGEREGE